MSTKSFYHDLIIDHYQNPRNFGELKNPDATAREANASCGDMVEFAIKVKPFTVNGLRITDVKWRGVGCAISTAAASLLSERIRQVRRISQIRLIGQNDMIALLGGISHARIKCATLPLIALQKAISNLTI